MIRGGEKERKGEVILGHVGSGNPGRMPSFQLVRMVMLGKSANLYPKNRTLRLRNLEINYICLTRIQLRPPSGFN